MHDALHQYEPDTVVEDVPDDEPAQPIARPRVDTEDLIVHIREAGVWHRRHPTKMQTACGLPWTEWNYRNQRSGRHIDPPLADCDCWSKAERDEAAEKQALSDLAIKGNVF